MEIYKKIAIIIEDVADIPASQIKQDSYLIDDLDLSSIEILAIISKIEDEYSIDISEKELLSIQSINDIVKIISSK